LDSFGETEVLPQHVGATIVLMAEAAVFPVLDALGEGNVKKLAVSLSRVENTTAGDPTIKVTRLLAPTLGKWISAAALLDKKVSTEDAAATLGQNAWVYSKKTLPPAKRWGLVRLVELLGIIAEAERQVFHGVISPWLHLEAGLLKSCTKL
jgi:DNA polymerase III delta subunit